jgi:hypothetical protein
MNNFSLQAALESLFLSVLKTTTACEHDPSYTPQNRILNGKQNTMPMMLIYWEEAYRL